MHSSEGIETFLSQVCHAVQYGRIFLYFVVIIVITVWYRIGDFLCFAGTNFCDKDSLMFLFRELIFAIFRKNQTQHIVSFLMITCNRNT